MKGEADHAALEEATLLGAARTIADYHLVDLGVSAALLAGGLHRVPGELYAVTPQILANIDVKRGHPVLHQRGLVKLEDGREADAYFISFEQARGVRRIRDGDWQKRPGGPSAGRKHDPG